MEILNELKMYRGEEELTRPVGHVAWASSIFAPSVRVMASPAVRKLMTAATRNAPIGNCIRAPGEATVG